MGQRLGIKIVIIDIIGFQISILNLSIMALFYCDIDTQDMPLP